MEWNYLPWLFSPRKTRKGNGSLSENIIDGLDWERYGNIVVYSSSNDWWASRMHERHWTSTSPQAQKRIFIHRSYPVHTKMKCQFQLDEKNVQLTFISAGMTGQLQPLDVAVNKLFKEYHTAEFHKWQKSLKKKDITKKDISEIPRGRRCWILFPWCGRKSRRSALKTPCGIVEEKSSYLV